MSARIEEVTEVILEVIASEPKTEHEFKTKRKEAVRIIADRRKIKTQTVLDKYSR